MKVPVQAAAVVGPGARRSFAAGLARQGDPSSATVSPGILCVPPDYYWCTCPGTDETICCQHNLTCNMNTGACICQST